MSLNLECGVCKEADLSDVASGALECGHVYCADCIYKLWHTETAGAAERREARAYQARLHPQTRAQMQARTNEDATDDGRKLRCPSCQRCSSVDTIRRVFISSSQAPSTVSATSPQTMTRTTSKSSASAEEVEDLSAQLAIALEHLDAAHAHAADSARAHDLHMRQMQTQLMAHAEQAHQSQVQELAETNAQLQRELRNAQAQLNQAAREASEIKAQFDRATRELSEAREKKRIAKARASEVTTKSRDAAMDRLADSLSANGTIGAPLRGGAHTTETRPQTRSIAPSTALSGKTKSVNKTERDDIKSPRPNVQSPIILSCGPPVSTRNRNPVPGPANPQSSSVSSGTRSRKSDPGAAEPIQTHAHSKKEIEEKYKPMNSMDKAASARSTIIASARSTIILEEDSPKRQTRATTSATKPQPQKTGNTGAYPVSPLSGISSRNTAVPSKSNYREPDIQHSLRAKAQAEGRRWPISEAIVVPPCSTGFEHELKGKGSNQTYLKYICEKCPWGCEKPTPDDYVPESKRRTPKKKKN